MLPVILCNLEGEAQSLLLGTLSQCADQARIAVQLRGQTASAAACHELLKDQPGICLAMIGLPPLREDPQLLGLKLGRRALAINRDSYVVFVLENRQDMEDVLSVCARVSGVLAIPIAEKRAQNVLRAVCRDYAQMQSLAQQPSEDQVLVLRSGAGLHRLPIRQIAYVQAIDKRIEVVFGAQALQFYSNMQQIGQRLGPDFLRCHRSYFVNRHHIAQIDWAQMLITLQGGAQLPLSRSYKDSLKDAFAESEA